MLGPMSDGTWIRRAGDRLLAGDTSGVLRECVPEILSLGNVARGHLLEIFKSAEDADLARLSRALDAGVPHLIRLNAGLGLTATALTAARRGNFENRDHTDQAVDTTLGVDIAMRGIRGTLLYHTRIAQTEALQATKLLALLDQRFEARETSQTAWEQFEKAICIVADEFDSILFSFRVLIAVLAMTAPG